MGCHSNLWLTICFSPLHIAAKDTLFLSPPLKIADPIMDCPLILIAGSLFTVDKSYNCLCCLPRFTVLSNSFPIQPISETTWPQVLPKDVLGYSLNGMSGCRLHLSWATRHNLWITSKQDTMRYVQASSSIPMSLKFISLNAKGLNSPFKRSVMRKEALSQRVDLLFIQETHFRYPRTKPSRWKPSPTCTILTHHLNKEESS